MQTVDMRMKFQRAEMREAQGKKTEKKGKPVRGCIIELTTTTGDWYLASQSLLRRFRTDYQGDPHLSISFHSPLGKGSPMSINSPIILGCTYGRAKWVPPIVLQLPLGKKQEIHKAGRGTHCKSGQHQLHDISWRKRGGQKCLKRYLRDVLTRHPRLDGSDIYSSRLDLSLKL